MSLLAIFDILGIFAETLTADYKYSPRNSDNLPKAIQMQLSKKQNNFYIHKNIFACLFSIHNTISLLCLEQVRLSGLRFERYFSPDDGRRISRNVAYLNILAHDMINLLYNNYSKQK